MKKKTKKRSKKTAKAGAKTTTVKAKTAGGGKVKASKAASEAKPKRLSALAAAAQVLKAAGKAMRAQELIAAMAKQGLWKSPAGKTPHATLYAAMLREERDKGASARFRKVDRGQFVFNAEAK